MRQPDTPPDSRLTFLRPAREWLEALPLGDGRLGVMCHGGRFSARFDLNHELLWSGSPTREAAQRRRDVASDLASLASARQHITDGRPDLAEHPVRQMQSDYAQAFLPLAAVTVELSSQERGAAPTSANERGPDDGYRRTLDLGSGVHEVAFGHGERRIRQRSTISAPDGVLVHTIEGAVQNTRASVSLSSELREVRRSENRPLGEGAAGWTESLVLLRAPIDVAPTHEPSFPAATWIDEPGHTVEAALVVRVRHEAGRITVLMAAETTAALPADGGAMQLTGTIDEAAERAAARLDAATQRGADELFARAEADHRELLGRVQLRLGAAERSGNAAGLRPTSSGVAESSREPGDDAAAGGDDTAARLSAAFADPSGPLAHDPGLVGLLFDYGRYLLVSSSRPGGLPATLQGIWNASMQPPWSSAYTLNINLQMNYWAAEAVALPEADEPLLRFVGSLARADGARETAARLGAEGWAAHHNSDAWGYTSPVGARHGDPSWAFWPMAGAWLVRHLWERVLFGAGDDVFLRETAWPVIREAARFGVGWMQERPGGAWVTSPSTSPENTFRLSPAPENTGALGASGAPAASDVPDSPGAPATSASLSVLTEADAQLLRDLFRITLAAADRVGAGDDELLAMVAERLAGLPASPRITAEGSVAEWVDDPPAVDHRHRHVSPLFFLYPGDAPVDDELATAATTFLTRRTDDSTGWSLAWKTALWARLGRADKVADLLALVFRDAGSGGGPWSGGLYPNLFAAHPPFQIDGNLGVVAAVVEALLQSHTGVIEVLPALPQELGEGSVSGLIARPGVVVDIEWHDAALTALRLRTRHDRIPTTHSVRYRGVTRTVTLSPHRSLRLTADDFTESGTTR